MSENLQLNIPHTEFFDKSPAHTPTKVLQALDLLSVDGAFLPKASGSSCGNISACSSLANSPAMNRRYLTQSNDLLRRRSLKSDVYYDHTISDEFSYINLSIKERRLSTESNDSLPVYSFNQISTRRKIDFENNPIVVAKVLAGGEEEGEIEIIDLDEDEQFQIQTSVPKENCYPVSNETN